VGHEGSYNPGIVFEWDESKNASNKRKHGISFEDASHVFEDPHAVLFIERVEDGEERWLAIESLPGTMLIVVVVHLYRADRSEEVVRIISARRAVERERKIYDEANA
jgi:uncharacterized DUF497 family protein